MYQHEGACNDENIFNGRINRFRAHPNKSKRQPLILVNAKNDVVQHTTKITDLNFDCLEYIVQSFSLHDLLRFGYTCVYLKKAACTVFTLMFRNHEVQIDCEQFPNCSVVSRSKLAHQRFTGGINFEELLTVFGDVITNMTIVKLRSMSKFNRLDNEQVMRDNNVEQLMKHCRQELLVLKLKDCGKQAMVNAQPFPKLTKISFERCVLGKGMANFSHLFPCMRKLEIIDCDVASVRDSINKPFPLLESFNVIMPLSANSMSASSFKADNLKAVIDQNPLIKNLDLCYWNESAYDAKVLKYAAVNLIQLKSLTLYHLRYTDFCSEGAIQFTTVQKLTLVNQDHGMGRLDRSLSALSFRCLQKFIMEGEFDSECVTFIARHKTIKKLTIFPTGEHDYYPSNDDIQRIQSVLPSLEKIQLDGKLLTANKFMGLITQSGTLSYVKVLRCSFTTPIRKLLQWKCLKYGWKVSDDGSTLTFKRKSQ